MAIFSTTDYDGDTNLLDIPHSLIIGIENTTDRCINILFGSTDCELLTLAVRDYVQITDRWVKEKEHHALNQDRRLAFIRLLRAVSAGSDNLAQAISQSHHDHA